jgi:hypothetical protein
LKKPELEHVSDEIVAAFAVHLLEDAEALYVVGHPVTVETVPVTAVHLLFVKFLE